jgi:hypothetical protein
LFGLAAELPFTDTGDGLYGIENRLRLEERLADAVSRQTGAAVRGGAIVVDVPEPLSFETDLFVRGKERPFDDGLSFFTAETAASCVRTLRVVRVFIDTEVCQHRPEALADAISTLLPLTDR